MTDSQLLRTLRDNLQWDGYMYWLPEWAIIGKNGAKPEEATPLPTMRQFRELLEKSAKRNTKR